MRAASLAPIAQGAVYLTSGLWPIVHLRSFERVTGPKVDGWLVKTVGGLLAVAGVALLRARRRPDPALRTLGIGIAAVLTTVDLIYVARRRISKIYLADAVLHTALAGAWLLTRPSSYSPDASAFQART